MRSLFLIAILGCASAAFAQKASPPKPELLVEPADMVAHFAGEDQFAGHEVVLLDVRSAQGFETGSIPGARNIDARAWKAAFGDGKDADAWSERIGKVIADADTVVVYDETFSPTAARIWWILKYWGVEDVRVLNGGTKGWKLAGGTIQPSTINGKAFASDFEAVPHPDRLATYEQVQAIAGEKNGATCLVDTRTERENAAGNIPSAKHLDWQQLVDSETGKLKSPEQLKSLLQSIGFDPTVPAVTYCRSGGRASVTAFAMEHIGGEVVANYYGSWGDWSKRTEK